MNVNLRPNSIASARKVNPSPVIAAHSQAQGAAAPVVIIGGGPSGIRVAQELARSGCDAILFNAERWKPYNRVKLTPLLSGDVQLGQVTQPLDFPGPGKGDPLLRQQHR